MTTIDTGSPDLTTRAEPDLYRSFGMLRARIRLGRTVRFASRGLLTASAVSLLAVVLARLRLFEAPAPWLLAIAIAAVTLAAAMIGLTRRLPDLEVARLTETRADLKQRLSSAVELGARSAPGSDPFCEAQSRDAARFAAGLVPAKVFPARPGWTAAVGLLLTLAVFLAYLLPTLPGFWSPARKRDAADVAQQGAVIVRLARDTQKRAEQSKLPQTARAAAEARKLGEAMQRGTIGKREALLAQNRLQRRMAEARKSLERSDAEALKRASDALKQAVERMKQAQQDAQHTKTPESRRAAPHAGAGKPAGEPSKSEEAMRKASAALARMADAMAAGSKSGMQDAMKALAEQLKSGNLSSKDLQALQQAVQQMAPAMQGSPGSEEMQQLSGAMQSAAAIDPNAAARIAALANAVATKMGGQMRASMDAQGLAELEKALEQGRMTAALGTAGSGTGGASPGEGYFGRGHNTGVMKQPGVTKPRLTAVGRAVPGGARGRTGSATDLLKYMSAKPHAAKYLPNGKIAGARTAAGQELETTMTGDPDPTLSSAPYYQVLQSNRRQAESALDRENIPAAYKQQVRKYFERLGP